MEGVGLEQTGSYGQRIAVPQLIRWPLPTACCVQDQQHTAHRTSARHKRCNRRNIVVLRDRSISVRGLLSEPCVCIIHWPWLSSLCTLHSRKLYIYVFALWVLGLDSHELQQLNLNNNVQQKGTWNCFSICYEEDQV